VIQEAGAFVLAGASFDKLRTRFDKLRTRGEGAG
jgi:hypothetical protein